MTLSQEPTTIVIRKMTADDLARVHELDKICFSAPWSLRNFRYELEDNQSSSQWVAEDQDGWIVGAIVTWLVVDEVHIATLSVDPAYRRHGIASRLVCTALQDGIQRGAAGLPVHQMERGKVGELEPLVEDQGGLDTPVGKKDVARELRQPISVLRHRSPPYLNAPLK